MKQFTDNKERSWTLSLNIASAKKVKDAVGFDLLSEDVGEMVGRLAVDPVMLCDVIYVMVSDQAERNSITDEDFGESMAGDAIGTATEALLDEIVDFFPPRKRVVLRMALDKMEEAEILLMSRAEDLIRNKTAEEIVQEVLREAEDGGSSLKSPDRSESIPSP